MFVHQFKDRKSESVTDNEDSSQRMSPDEPSDLGFADECNGVEPMLDKCRVRKGILAGCLVLVVLPAVSIVVGLLRTNVELESLYALPEDYNVVPITAQNCSVADLVEEPGNLPEIYQESAAKLFAWLTGTRQEAYYQPVIRDADPKSQQSVVREAMASLDDSQRQILYDLMEERRPLWGRWMDDRISFIDELWSLKAVDASSNRSRLDFDSALEGTTSMAHLEAEMAVLSARHYASLTATLTPEQHQHLTDLRGGSNRSRHADHAESKYDGLLNDLDRQILTQVISDAVVWVTEDVQDFLLLPRGPMANFFGFSNYANRANVSSVEATAYVEEVLTRDQLATLCGLSRNVVQYANDYVDGRTHLVAMVDQWKLQPQLELGPGVDEYALLAGEGEGRSAVLEALTFHWIESTMSEAQKHAIRLRRGD